jgi:hypothetical protein
MDSLTARIGFMDEHIGGLAIAQDQGIASYLWNGLGLVGGLVQGAAPPTVPDFLGAHLDLLLITRNEIWREVL